MTEQERDQSSGEGEEGFSAGTVAAAAGLGVVAGFAIASLWPKDADRLSGDEAPIRVKNGSLELKLLRLLQIHANQQFQETGTGGKKWKIRDDPPRGKPEYTVVALPGDLRDCPNGLVLIGQKVEVTYTDGATVSLKATGNHTTIDSTEPLTHDAGATPEILLYPKKVADSGWISRVTVGGKVLYKRVANGPDSTLQIVLLDV